LGRNRRVFAVERPQNGRFALIAIDNIGQHIDQHFHAQNIAQKDEFLTVVIAGLACALQVFAAFQKLAMLQFHIFAEPVQMLDQRGHDLALAVGDFAMFAKAVDHDFGDIVQSDSSHNLLLRVWGGAVPEKRLLSGAALLSVTCCAKPMPLAVSGNTLTRFAASPKPIAPGIGPYLPGHGLHGCACATKGPELLWEAKGD
jgi:hypothetical protein